MIKLNKSNTGLNPLTTLKTQLDKHKMKDAFAMVKNDLIPQMVASDAQLMWDVIPLVCCRLRGLNEFRFKTFQYCREILQEIAQTCKPKEVLIALLAELENDSDGKDDNCFKAIVKPLQYVLLQLPTKRNETLKWVLSTLNTHLVKIDLPKEYNLEGKERLLLEQDASVKRYTAILPLYVQFLQPFVDEVDVTRNNNQQTNIPNDVINHKGLLYPQTQRDILLRALLLVLDHPLLYLDLNRCYESSLRVWALCIVQLIAKLQSNFYTLLDRRDLITESSKKDLSDLQLPESSFDNAAANISYLITCEDACPTFYMPMIYDHCYVFERHLPLIATLLQQRKSLVCEKGLFILNKLISRLAIKQLDSTYIDILKIKSTQLEHLLFQVMMYSSVQSHRQLALKCFKDLVNCFTNVGRCQILYSILSKPGQEDAIKGLTIGMYKDYIAKEKDNQAFLGTNLQRMIKTCINSTFSNGAETDLLSNNDSIFALLNFIRYMFLRDKKQFNETRVWNIKNFIVANFISPLRTAIDLSRAHYKLEWTKLKEDTSSRRKNVSDFKIEIQNNPHEMLPNLPPDYQEQVIKFALQNFDMIESVLVRVDEIANE